MEKSGFLIKKLNAIGNTIAAGRKKRPSEHPSNSDKHVRKLSFK
jgi:hypothetical protein